MIQHVAIEVREADVEACVRFWALLGFERVAAPPALAERSTWVQAGSDAGPPAVRRGPGRSRARATSR